MSVEQDEKEEEEDNDDDDDDGDGGGDDDDDDDGDGGYDGDSRSSIAMGTTPQAQSWHTISRSDSSRPRASMAVVWCVVVCVWYGV